MKLEGIEVDAYCIAKLHKYDSEESVHRITEVTKDYFSIGQLRFNHDGSFKYNTVTKSRSDKKKVLRIVSKKDAIDFLIKQEQYKRSNKHFQELRQKCASKVNALSTFDSIDAMAKLLGVEHVKPIVTENDVLSMLP